MKEEQPSREAESVAADVTFPEIGWKLLVHKDGERRIAQVLMIKTFNDQPLFYVHYQDFNKRLDEWISLDKFDFSQPIELPKPAAEKKIITVPKKDGKFVKRQRSDSDAFQSKKRARTENNQLDLDENVDEEIISENTSVEPQTEELELDAEQNTVGKHVSREQEIEKLRTSGSMTHNPHEVARIRNLTRVKIGRYELEPWYFSPYPVSLTKCDLIYICEFCLSFYGSKFQFGRHRAKCTSKHPPGNEIYRDDTTSFFEIDGRKQRTWCRNLCLFSKLFLDHKTLYYDVDPFLFYCMCTWDEYGYHLNGYFSKEKESAENYNVACILTLPQHQRFGFGKLLISFSYELTKRDGKLGSPEKPLSDLGLLSYRSYWADLIVSIIMNKRTETTIDQLANETSMTTQDVLHTLQSMNMLKYYKGQHVIVISKAIEQYYENFKKKKKRLLKPDLLSGWQPPVFHPAALRFGW